MLMQHQVTSGTVLPTGFKASGVRCGIQKQGNDLALLVSDAICPAAGMWTTNTVAAHCIVRNQEILKNQHAKAIVVNAGNANSCTGEPGRLDNLHMAEYAAQKLGCRSRDVLVLSTGVIGERLPMPKIRTGIDLAVPALSEHGGADAAQAIMTTDTVPKFLEIPVILNGVTGRISALAKGSGMIDPNLATMFCLVMTDIDIPADLLEKSFRDAVNDTLNVLTVDGEMSTNDAAVMLANGRCGNAAITKESADYETFKAALQSLLKHVTLALAKDGEGAGKEVCVHVIGAGTHADALRAAKSIGNSLLVKTALFGEDPNWGRVVQAAGASGADMDADAFDVWFAGLQVAENGGAIGFDKQDMAGRMAQDHIDIVIDLKVGDAEATVYTCDLSYKYVEINAEYHT
ncbi:MAG: bifunctional glutamate N-acetyltransferase/amino-acid acetyltransferase ArgJ [candidate division KSB1 bacterium]|nr:bifunctional glutamate N-acetyltransferase/amino-acid acetyltransferase ArgJ [candidate division KSB1 bacterium]